MTEADSLYVCWTTAASRDDAERLAALLVEKGLAACVQIDSPMTSFYSWEGKVEQDSECRLWIKALGGNLEELELTLAQNHPYDTPQWVCAKAEKVSEKYLKWARDVSTLRGFI